MASLSGGRVVVAMNAVMNSIIAVTIAGRYSAIRKQFGPPGKPEQAIIEYPLTQYRVLPNVATVIAQQLAASHLCIVWDENLKHLLDVKNTLMNELHAISSVLKALTSWTSTRIITEMRQVLGGHGYSKFNRFGQLYNDNGNTINKKSKSKIKIRNFSNTCSFEQTS